MDLMKGIDVVVGVLLVLGGLNWGLMGFFDINLIEVIFGAVPYLSRIIYGIVGLCGLYQALMWSRIASRWGCTVPGFTHTAA
ncbi:MAG: DUF378 domain-containing protein [Thermodesulfobacteriota bacterium]